MAFILDVVTITTISNGSELYSSAPRTRPSYRWISSTDTYKPYLASISAQMQERERERGGVYERDNMRDNWSLKL